jgi:hypothetical protein
VLAPRQHRSLPGAPDARALRGFFMPIPFGYARRSLSMLFRLVNAEYDPDTKRAYVELRANDDDDGEIIATAIFTFHSKAKLTSNRRSF